MSDHIATINDVEWHFDRQFGRITGLVQSQVIYTFYVGNPPRGDSPELPVFVMVCEVATSLGKLRRIPVYAAV